MHNLGKIFIVLVMLFAGLAIWLESKMLHIRHGWLTTVDKRQTEVEKQLEDIAKLRQQILELEKTNQSLVLSWGEVWAAPNSRKSPSGEPIVEVGIGASSNLPGNQADGTPSTVYVFSQGPDRSNYLGSFLVGDTRPNQALLQLSRNPFAGETASWPEGFFKIRGSLPSNYLTTNASLETDLLIADSRVAEQQAQLATQGVILAGSQKNLERRMQELNGNPNAAPDAAQDVRDGLVITAQKEEAARDQLQSQVNQLREAVTETYERIRAQQLENQQRIRELDNLYTPTLPVQTANSL